MDFASITFELPSDWKTELKGIAKKRKMIRGSCTVSDLIREAIHEVHIKPTLEEDADSSPAFTDQESERKSA